MAPSRYDLSCCRVVKHKQTIKQTKGNKNNTQFQHDVLRDNKYGNEFLVNLIESEGQKWVPGIRKKEHVIVVSEDTKSIKQRQKMDSSKKFAHN